MRWTVWILSNWRDACRCIVPPNNWVVYIIQHGAFWAVLPALLPLQLPPCACKHSPFTSFPKESPLILLGLEPPWAARTAHSAANTVGQNQLLPFLERFANIAGMGLCFAVWGHALQCSCCTDKPFRTGPVTMHEAPNTSKKGRRPRND
jgi:hypothetical protein